MSNLRTVFNNSKFFFQKRKKKWKIQNLSRSFFNPYDTTFYPQVALFWVVYYELSFQF